MILVECYLDEYLIRSLGFPKNVIRHESGKGRIINFLRKHNGNIGIIDEDPDSNQPKDLMNYYEISSKGDLKLLQRNNSSSTYVIIIPEFLEKWLVKRANANEILLSNYNLNSEGYLLHKSPHIERRPNFQRFLHDLIKTDEEIDQLGTWLKKYQ